MALTYVGNSDLQTVTLGSEYTSGSGSMSLTAGHGARLPSSGDFWIRTKTGTYRSFKVTARSTDTLTVTAAQDGTSDGTVAAGTELAWVLGASALDQLKSDSTGVRGSLTVAQLDALTGSDRYGIVRPTDGNYEHIWNGSSWDTYYIGVKCTRHVVSDFTLGNQGSAVVEDYGDIVRVRDFATGASDSNRCLMVTAPSMPFTFRVRWQYGNRDASAAHCGILLRNSSDGKLVIARHHITGNGTIFLSNYNSFTSNNSNATSRAWPVEALMTMKVAVSSGSAVFTTGAWDQSFSTSNMSWISNTVNQVGIAICFADIALASFEFL
jgi:hypothetical protein